MLGWISETWHSMLSWIPIWLYAEGTPRYFLVRGMLGLGLIVLIVLVIALRPDRIAADCYRRHRAKGEKPGA